MHICIKAIVRPKPEHTPSNAVKQLTEPAFKGNSFHQQPQNKRRTKCILIRWAYSKKGSKLNFTLIFIFNWQIWQFLACFIALQLTCCTLARSVEQSNSQNQRLSTAETETETDLSSDALENLYRYGRTLSRLRRALVELEYEEAADDMELAEINVFRPLFRYRAEIARQVKNPRQQQQQFG